MKKLLYKFKKICYDILSIIAYLSFFIISLFKNFRHKIGTFLRLKCKLTHATIGIAYSFPYFQHLIEGAFFVPVNSIADSRF